MSFVLNGLKSWQQQRSMRNCSDSCCYRQRTQGYKNLSFCVGMLLVRNVGGRQVYQLIVGIYIQSRFCINYRSQPAVSTYGVDDGERVFVVGLQNTHTHERTYDLCHYMPIADIYIWVAGRHFQFICLLPPRNQSFINENDHRAKRRAVERFSVSISFCKTNYQRWRSRTYMHTHTFSSSGRCTPFSFIILFLLFFDCFFFFVFSV